MSAKRAAISSPSSGSRQFKQTKLSFGSFTSARKRPRPAPEDHDDQSATATTDEAAANKEQPEEPQQKIGDDTVTDAHQAVAEATNNTSTNPGPASDSTPGKPRAALPPPNPPGPSASRIRIIDKTGDLFAAPPNTLLIHACNSVGSWGGGIALAFRQRYPDAFKRYRAHCLRSAPDQLVGTALLIPPHQQASGHYIGCLFTSRRYGKARDPPGMILRATGPAMRDLMRLVVEEERRAGVRMREIRMCRINSGLFAVPWGRSKSVIEGLELGEGEVPAASRGDRGVVEVVAYEKE